MSRFEAGRAIASVEGALEVLSQLQHEYQRRWTVVGGCMVFLHAIDAGVEPPRPFHDLDVVVDARGPGTPIKDFSDLLTEMGFAVADIGREGQAHRFRRGEVELDVLAPDHLGPRAKLGTAAGGHTLEAPGGSEALNRTELTTVRFSNFSGLLPRPTIVGAIVTKAAALTAAPAGKHVDDLLFLVSLVSDIGSVHAELKKSDRRRLRSALAAIDSVGYGRGDGTKRQARTLLRALGRGAG